MNLPLPVILYPFANGKEEYFIRDHGAGNLNLVPTNLKWESSSQNTLGIPNHSVNFLEGELAVDISSLTINEMTIVFHFYVQSSGKIFSVLGGSSADYFEIVINADYSLAFR